MKKILFFFALFLSTLSASEIDEYKVDLYYANGIMFQDDEEAAQKIWERRVKNLLQKYPQLQTKIGKTDVAYNISHGIVEDLWESFNQKVDLEPGWNTGWEGFKEVINRIPLTKAVGYLIEAAEIANEYINGNTLDEQVTKYKESIESGHGVVVVAHSQGNLFTSQAYNRLVGESKDGWMGKFFHTIAVASPASSVVNDGKGVTFDNDMIIAVGSSENTIPNPNRHDHYEVTRNALGEIIDTELQTDVLSIVYHGFEYYLGYPVYEEMTRADLQGGTRRLEAQTDDAKTLILGWMYDEILNHSKQPSQWTPKNKGCLCKEKYAKMTHMYDPATMDSYLANEKVKDFAESSKGKIYKADAGEHAEYVRALDGDRSDDGVFTIEETNKDDVCFVLKDDAAGEVGGVKGANAMSVPESGIIGISLSWDDADVKLSLSSDIGKKDITATECPFEHYFVKSEADVEPGTYGVYVTHSGEVEDESLPQSVKIDIHAPGAALVFDLEITAEDMLNLGHVANIIISERNTVEVESTSSAIGITCYGNCSGPSGSYLQYIYEIQSKLKQALLGPLSTANINLTQAEDFANRLPFYESSTSGGDSIVTAGLFYFTSEALALLEPDTYYVMSVTGGNDIDANDDGIADTTPTPNTGSIHAVVSTDTLTNENFKTNILTEVAFVLTEEMMTEELNTTALQEKLDDIAKRLLIQDVDGDKEVNYNDLLAWVPTVDKDKLRKPYATFYEPIAQKIYRNETIYNDAYALAYEPFFREKEIKIDENASAGTIVAQVAFELLDEEASYSLVEENDFFEILSDGTIILKDSATLDYETNSTILLHVQATSTHGEITIVQIPIAINNIPEFAPILHNLALAINKDTKVGTVIGNVLQDDSETSLHKIEILSSSPFAVDFDGNIKVATSLLEVSDNSYVLKVEAENIVGKSNISHLNITFVAPVIHDVLLKVFDNSASLSEVGILEIVKNGNPIETITLSGDGSSDFTIDVNGVIRVAEGVTLDASRKDSYVLTVHANNSAEATVTILLYKRILASIDTLGYAEGVTLSSDGAKAFVANGLSGLQIIDISNLSIPTNVSFIDTPGYATSVTLSLDGTIAYVADDYAGLQIIDVSDPALPTILASINTLGFGAQNVVLSADETRAYVANGYLGLQIIDVSDPSSPSIVASVDTPEYAHSVALSSDGTKAYIADGSSGLQTIEVSDQNIATIVTSVEIDAAQGVTLSEDDTKAYVVDYGLGLKILDISNPIAPTILSSIDTLQYALSVTLSTDGTRAYVADGRSGLQIIDVSHSKFPVIVTSIDTPSYAESVTLSSDGTKAFVADSFSGLQIIDVSGF